MNKALLLITSLLFFTMTNCAQEKDKKDYIVTIKTEYGDMIALLYDDTPKHRDNFVKLAKEKFYDSLLFHRCIQGFMIQGGDPESKHAKPGQPLGNGGPGYTVDAEFNPTLFHEKGSLSAARLPDQVNPSKSSSGSQFYIVQGTVYPEADLKVDQQKLNSAMMKFFQNPANRPVYDSMVALYRAGNMAEYEKMAMNLKSRVEKETGISVERSIPENQLKAYSTVGGAPHLDGGYTVFGKVIKGLEVIDKIAAQPRDRGDRPLKDIRMTVTVEEMSKKKIEKEFGYIYPASK